MVSVAGPYRKGKSYVLSEAFDQPGVFPLGHHFDPETMGIWMWIVPRKFRVMINFKFCCTCSSLLLSVGEEMRGHADLPYNGPLSIFKNLSEHDAIQCVR